jgi:hypothetical protein
MAFSDFYESYVFFVFFGIAPFPFPFLLKKKRAKKKQREAFWF